jgi:hypothetical protein
MGRSPNTRITPAPSMLPPFSPSQPSEGSAGRRMLRTAPNSLGGGGGSSVATGTAATAGSAAQGSGSGAIVDAAGNATGATAAGPSAVVAGAYSHMGGNATTATTVTATSVLMDSWLQQQVAALVAKQEAEARALRLDARLKALQERRAQLGADLTVLKQHLRVGAGGHQVVIPLCSVHVVGKRQGVSGADVAACYNAALLGCIYMSCAWWQGLGGSCLLD